MSSTEFFVKGLSFIVELLLSFLSLFLEKFTLCERRIADETVNDDKTKAMRKLNHDLKHDDRIELLAPLTLGSGLTIIVKNS